MLSLDELPELCSTGIRGEAFDVEVQDACCFGLPISLERVISHDGTCQLLDLHSLGFLSRDVDLGCISRLRFVLLQNGLIRVSVE